jgi:tetratricopeptide (TPR) repeat protein
MLFSELTAVRSVVFVQTPMSKHRRKKKRKSRPAQKAKRGRQPSAELQKAFERADSLITRGCTQEAVELLEPFLTSYPRVADLHYYVGYARVMAGDVWGGVVRYERAIELSRDPGYWLPLAALYLKLEMTAQALHAFRQALRRQSDIPKIEDVREIMVALEEEIQEVARYLDMPVEQVEKGLRYMEEGQIALHDDNFPACIAASRRAIGVLRDWPPSHNNLSLGLFFNGQPEKAIAAARRVLSQAPDNIHALANAIRFLAWTGQEAEARALWPRLKAITPQNPSLVVKIVEAAAVLGEDESVYQFLHPLDGSRAREGMPELDARLRFFLAIAEANTGRRRKAKRRLKALRKDTPWAGQLLAALEAGQSGPGLAERFSYFPSVEFIPARELEKLVDLISRQDDLPPKRFRSQVARLAARFPQVVLMAEKLIWEEQQVIPGIAFLEAIATPAACDALRRFGLSQAGADDDRMGALNALMRMEEIGKGETVRVWFKEEWREVQMRLYEISDEHETGYPSEIADLLNQGLSVFQQDDHEQAERLFLRALELEPRAKEAYNNLGTIYAHRGEHERAREMLRAALEIDPTYVFPLCNLASYLLDEDDGEGAEAMLKPLSDAAHFRPQEMAFYSYVQARILVWREEYEAAHRTLEVTLEIYPGYEPAEEMLESLDRFAVINANLESFWEQQHKRDQAKRARLQAKLSTPEPSLLQALSVHTKDALTGVARVVVRWGGWSALRKAELIERIVTELGDPNNLERLVASLDEDECAALCQVLASGGVMPWQDFDADYGNDLEESVYWNWHEPETVMGRLRLRGLLAEATVDGGLLVVVPSELRRPLREMLV